MLDLSLPAHSIIDFCPFTVIFDLVYSGLSLSSIPMSIAAIHCVIACTNVHPFGDRSCLFIFRN